MPTDPPLRLRLDGISKRLGATQANDGVTLAVAPGEIHALIGENGAGKSTLMRIICGLLRPDAGRIAWNGADVFVMDPDTARRLGIAMVFQHFSLFETLTVAENVALGLRTRESLPALARRITAVAARYGLAVSPGRHVHELSVGERQRVEIVRCLLQEPHLLILDEPTSVLTPQEADGLFATLRRLAAEGCSILYTSHKLEEVAALCTAATVLRAGRVVAHCDPTRTSPAELAELMVGRALPHSARRRGQPGAPLLQVAGLSLPAADPFGTTLDGIGFELHAGEILGVAGVAGNGQSELLAVLSGERRSAAGTVRLDGRDLGPLGPAARRDAGLAFIPEERLGRGAVAELSLADNMLLTRQSDDLCRGGFVRRRGVRAAAAAVIQRFGVRAAGAGAPAASLSGGNMQKFIVGREVMPGPRVLLAAHPTWGVDIGASLAIREELSALAAAGAGVLVVSEDLAELFELCDRIAVLSGGRLVPARPVEGLTSAEIGQAMGGMSHPGAAGGLANAA